MSKTNYEIIINEAKDLTSTPTHEYNYYHPIEHHAHILIAFSVFQNNAYIRIVDSNSPAERIKNFSADEIRDTFRKVYLYHILHFGKELTPKTITIKINGEEMTYCEKDCKPEFPFVFSMITVPDDFSLTRFDNDLIIKIIKESKTKQFKSDKYACLYAFLGGIGKSYINDQFIYFWTAINAYYNCISASYNNMLLAELNEDAKFNTLSDDDKKSLKTFIGLVNDEKNLHALALLSSRNTTFNKAKPTKIKNYAPNKGGNDRRDGENSIIIDMSTWFQKWNHNWEEMLTALKQYTPIPKDPTDDKVGLKDIFQKLCYKQIDPYAWVVFKFPYIFRCNSLHGSRAYLAFAGYNEPELLMVEAMCYCMRDFLNANIQNIFKKELLSSEEYERIKVMCANYQSLNNLSEEAQNYLIQKGYVSTPKKSKGR